MQENNNSTRLLYDRKTAALQLSISIRMLDYAIANRQIATRRIGRKVLIPHSELVRFSRADHFDIHAMAVNHFGAAPSRKRKQVESEVAA